MKLFTNKSKHFLGYDLIVTNLFHIVLTSLTLDFRQLIYSTLGLWAILIYPSCQ